MKSSVGSKELTWLSHPSSVHCGKPRQDLDVGLNLEAGADIETLEKYC